MSRLGAILIPLLGGFLLTVAVVSWRPGWWQRRDAPQSAAGTPMRVALRRSQLRVVQVNLSSAPSAPVTNGPAARATAVPAAAPEPLSAPLGQSPVPRVDPGNSPEQLEAPARKFARGANPGED